MPGAEVGSCYATIGLDSKDFTSGLESAKSSFSSAAEGIQAKGESMAGSIKGAIGGILEVIAPLAGVFSAAFAVNSLISFQEQSYNLERQSKLTGDALKQVTDGVRDLSTNSNQSRDSLMGVASTLGLIDKSTSGIMTLTKSVADLAEVSGGVNTDIAALDVQIAKVWGEGTPGIERLNNAVIGLKSSLGADESTTLSFIGTWGKYLKQMGETDTQAAALSATFQNLGVDGDSAMSDISKGTSTLMTKIGTLTDTSEKMTKATKKQAAGYTDAAIEAQGKLSNIEKTFGESGQQIMTDLQNDFSGTIIKLGKQLSLHQHDLGALQSSYDIFGRKGTEALIDIGNAQGTLATATKVASDAAGNQAEKQDLLSKKTEQLGTKIGNLVNIGKDIALAFGEQTEGPLNAVLNTLLSFGRTVDQIARGSISLGSVLRSAFDSLSNLPTIEKITILATAIGGIVLVASQLGGLAAMLVTFINPVTIAIGLVAVLGAYFVNWSKVGKDAADVIGKLTTFIGNLSSKLKNGDFKGAFNDISIAVKKVATDIYTYFSHIDLKAALSNSINVLKTWIGGALDFGSSVLSSIKGIDWAGVGSTILSGLGSAFNTLKGIGQSVYDSITSINWSNIGQSVLSSLKGVASEITGLFSGIDLGKLWSGIESSATSAITSIQNALKGIDFSGMWNTLTTSISGVATSIYSTLNNIKWGDLGYQVGKALSSAIESAITSLSNIGSTITGYLKTAASSAGSIGSDIGNAIKGGLAAISGWMDQAKTGFLTGWDDTGTKIGEFIKTGLAKVVDYAKGIYDNIYNGIKAWVDSDALSKIGKDAGANFLKAIGAAIYIGAAGISTIASALWTALTQAPRWIAMGVEAIGKFAQGFVQGALDTLVDGMELALLKGVQAALNQIATSTHIPGLDTWAKNSLDPVNTEIEKLQTRLTKLGDTHVDAGVDVDTSYVGGSDPSSLDGKTYSSTMNVATNYLPTTLTTTTGESVPAPKIGGTSGYDQGAVQYDSTGNKLTALYNGVRLNTDQIIKAMQLQGIDNAGIRNTLLAIQATRTAGNIATGTGAGNPLITDAYFKKMGIATDNDIKASEKINAADAATANSINTENISTAKQVATITTEAIVASSKNFFGSAQGAGQLIYGAGSDFFGFSQAAGSNLVSASQAAAATQAQASGYAATALKLGAEVGAKFTTDAGNAVSISMANGGTALIGSIGQGSSNFVNSSNQVAAIGINSADQQSETLKAGSTSAGTDLTTAGTNVLNGLTTGTNTFTTGAGQVYNSFAGLAASVGGIATSLIGGVGSWYAANGQGGNGGGSTISTGHTSVNANGAIINPDGSANYTTVTCLGDTVLVNALKYTSPAGETTYYNPLAGDMWEGSSGTDSYQSVGVSSSAAANSAYASMGGGANLGGSLWGAKGYLADKGPQVIGIGEAGPELVLPSDITKTIMNLTSNGQAMSQGVFEVHVHQHLDGREISEQVFRIGAASMRAKSLSIR